MRANKKLALYVDQGLLGITQFQAATELLTKARRKLGTFTDDPALQAEVLAQSEALFNAMLDRLMHEKRLTVKTISTEVAHLLAVAGLADSSDAPQAAAPGPEGTVPVRAALTNFQRMNLAQLTAPELAEVVKVAPSASAIGPCPAQGLGGGGSRTAVAGGPRSSPAADPFWPRTDQSARRSRGSVSPPSGARPLGETGGALTNSIPNTPHPDPRGECRYRPASCRDCCD